MDTQLLQQATSQVQAQSESKPLRNGAHELENALQGTKVCNAPINDLKAVLRRCFLLVGLRAANLPSPEETQILTAFIYKKFSALTIEEIQIAFEKAVAGELECDANCYENFSPAYFGQIMSSYKKWASQKFTENQMYLVKPQTTNLLTMPADWKELCEGYYQDYLNNKFVFNVMPWQLYDEFVKCDMMAEDAFESWMNEAKVTLTYQLKFELTETSKELEKEELKERIRSIQNGENETKIEQQAKKLAVQFLYKTAKEKGFKNLFIKT